jgi:hypothetical protein
MTIRSSLVFPLLLANAAVIDSLSSFSFTQSQPTTLRQSLDRPGLSTKWSPQPQQDSSFFSIAASKVTQLQVAAADVEADIDMPELGNDGVYHILDERQYK